MTQTLMCMLISWDLVKNAGSDSSFRGGAGESTLIAPVGPGNH